MAEPVAFLLSTPEMSAIFSPSAQVAGMLTFESALARVQGRLGIIPATSAEAIAEKCNVELFDVGAIYEEAERAGSPVIPLVKRLIELVPGEAKRYVHWGTTSQDAIDSALMLQIRSGLSLIVDGLNRVSGRCAELARRHRGTVMAGRTLLQHAVPITFGLRAARWMAMTERRVETLLELRQRALAVQLGGAAGTLAAFGQEGVEPAISEDRGLRVMEELAEELDLPAPLLPWHAERDRVGEIAGQLGVVAGSMAKIAGDIVLLSQTEIAEACEAGDPGRGGSSAMPQKRNPVDAVRALAAARLAVGEVGVVLSAMAQAHERGAGDWQSEWSAVPDLFRHTACAVDAAGGSLLGLDIDSKRMAQNLGRTKGLIMAESLTMALASSVGRPEAQRIVGDLCRRVEESDASLAEAAKRDARVTERLTDEQIELALDPAAYLGSTNALIERSLDSFRSNQARRAHP